VKTGSLITSIVNGHWKESRRKEATAPAVSDSARYMLSAGAGASSGAATDKAAVEATEVRSAPDDPSENDKLNLAINIASASAIDMVLGVFLTSVRRSGTDELTDTLTPAAATPASTAPADRSTKFSADYHIQKESTLHLLLENLLVVNGALTASGCGSR
jgi:hypothetical protein